MSTPRKRRRPEDPGEQEELDSRQSLRASSSASSSSIASEVGDAAHKKRSLHGVDANEPSLAPQHAGTAPSSSETIPQIAVHGAQAQNPALRTAPRSPGPGFITSSPMTKKQAKQAASSSRGSLKQKAPGIPARRLSDEFDTLARETPDSAAQAHSSGSNAPHVPSTHHLQTVNSLHTTSDLHTIPLRRSSGDVPPPARHPSLHNPHGDQVEEANSSIMNSIFSPGLRSYVTQKFHAFTTSIGVRPHDDGSDREVTLTSSGTILNSRDASGERISRENSQQNSSSSQSASNAASGTSDSIGKIRLPSANGIHHAAYRKRPLHGLTASSSSTPTSSVPPSPRHPAAGDTPASPDTSDSQHFKFTAVIPTNARGMVQDTNPRLTSSGEVKSSGFESISEHDNKEKTFIGSRHHDNAENAGERDELFKKIEISAPEGVEEGESRGKGEEKIQEEPIMQVEVNERDEDQEEEEEEEETEIAAPEEVEGEEDVSEEEFDAYLFMANVPPRSSLEAPAIAPPGLPQKLKNSPRLTLVLDLDETLVHCSLEKIDNPDLIFTVQFDEVEYQVYVRKRPGFEEFLTRVSELFEVAVFTASQKAYADKLLNILDPGRKWIQHRLFRESCICVQGNYLKDLTVLGRDLSKIAIVDNSPYVFAYQIDNGVPIESWYNDSRDRELLHLLPFLESLVHVQDVRPVIRDKFQLAMKVEESLRTFQNVARIAASAAVSRVVAQDESDDSENESNLHNTSSSKSSTSTARQAAKKSAAKSKGKNNPEEDENNTQTTENNEQDQDSSKSSSRSRRGAKSTAGTTARSRTSKTRTAMSSSRNQREAEGEDEDDTFEEFSSTPTEISHSHTNINNTSIIEGDDDDEDDDERTVPAKTSRRKSRVRSRIRLAQDDSDSDIDLHHVHTTQSRQSSTSSISSRRPVTATGKRS